MLKLLFFISSLFLVQKSYAQFVQSNSFGRQDGLVANTIYNIVEDDLGFLWIATDAGVFRFDGKYFQLFTMEDGLTDNEVLKIMKEPNGVIWLNTFKNLPAYFDATKNRFINYKDDILLQNLKGFSNSYMNYTLDGSIVFFSKDSLFAIKDKKISRYPILSGNQLVLDKGNNELISVALIRNNFNDVTIQHRNNSNLIESKLLTTVSANIFPRITGVQNEIDILYDVKSGKAISKLLHLTNFGTSPLTCQTDTFLFQSKVNQLSNTKQYLIGSYLNGDIEIYNKQSKQFVQTLQTNHLVNSVFEDHLGTLWVSTNKGILLKFEKTKITQLQLPSPLNDEQYLSILKSKMGTYYLGDYKSKIIEKQNSSIKIHTLPLNNKAAGWQRETIKSQGKIFTFSDAGIYVNYSNPIFKQNLTLGANLITIKAAIVYNDTQCILGSVNSLISLNTKTYQTKFLNNFEHRVTSILKYNNSILYIGSNDGIYKYDIVQEKEIQIIKSNSLWQERIMSICMGDDSLIWVATACNGILVIYNDSIVAHITSKNGLPTNSLRCISYGFQKRIGIGSELGFTILDYSATLQNIKVTNFTINDGLSSNVISKILFENDTFYLATNKGISIVPASIQSNAYAIPVYLIDLQINDKQFPIDSTYHLEKNQNSIRLQLGGVELKGHFKQFEYSVDAGNQWTIIEGNILNLELENGKHKLWIRAVDNNGNRSIKPLILFFDIAISFWETWWFWLLIGLLLLSASLYFYQQYLKRKHQLRINNYIHKQQLDDFEIQALKAQINPHFVFNCLNSIKALIYEEKLDDADLYLNTFGSLLRTTLNYSSTETISLQEEVDYIDNYLQLEKLRFNNKFEYQINIHEGIDKEKIQLPAMLLQPFLENSVNHGISQLRGVLGKIIVDLRLVDNNLHISIDDNGIGRKKAQDIKKQQITKYESKGIQLTERRLALHQIECIIIDKKDDNDKATGTTIELIIPNI